MEQKQHKQAETDWSHLKQEIIAYAHKIGIDKIGFASSAPFLTLKERLYKHRELGYESGFEEKDIEKRTHPEQIMPEAKSIIAIALAYPSRMEAPPKSTPGNYRGIMARVSWGEDYHRVLRDRLKKLEQFLHEKVPDIKTEIMVDTGALSDRAVAERAGLGWVGKNTSLITPEFGSWVYLGEMLTSAPFPPDKPIEDECGDCTICIDACPTGAIVQRGQVNSQRCIAFLTQVKDMIPEAFRPAVGNRLYGCDTCQQVCPKNRKINFTHHPEFVPDPEMAKPLLKPLLTISKKEFAAKFGRTSGAWRGKKPIQRNAILALAHFKDKSAVPDLIEIMTNDERPVMRGTAAWALGRIGGDAAITALKKAKTREKVKTVLREIEKALSLTENVE
ncbi:tRNA epoxyqueuosine(34) reductase QueG [Aneurinibacillus thermoaerophilus]|uniref:tRNA epoxyqueuosine(34) reductase QueG n=1 Tax=Aneurinibacillus thermoaerophilus TaxID=143495 RepID=UPI002E1F0968|nr:tRNA epoxyqueuosine(34) reductase QueG [Aneurinibacillus thermoaerophilus]MED0678200.1 tRNA epoxyqueuosine(34) reductase QueG [Aneurinibacillus thermoaerophilus]MED0766078.1 tRNA epoxyqueuosine(34) reductase QueG [Aneurinibacillus thermoaerophilus]